MGYAAVVVGAAPVAMHIPTGAWTGRIGATLFIIGRYDANGRREVQRLLDPADRYHRTNVDIQRQSISRTVMVKRARLVSMAIFPTPGEARDQAIELATAWIHKRSVVSDRYVRRG